MTIYSYQERPIYTEDSKTVDWIRRKVPPVARRRLLSNEFLIKLYGGEVYGGDTLRHLRLRRTFSDETLTDIGFEPSPINEITGVSYIPPSEELKERYLGLYRQTLRKLQELYRGNNPPFDEPLSPLERGLVSLSFDETLPPEIESEELPLLIKMPGDINVLLGIGRAGDLWKKPLFQHRTLIPLGYKYVDLLFPVRERVEVQTYIKRGDPIEILLGDYNALNIECPGDGLDLGIEVNYGKLKGLYTPEGLMLTRNGNAWPFTEGCEKRPNPWELARIDATSPHLFGPLVELLYRISRRLK